MRAGEALEKPSAERLLATAEQTGDVCVFVASSDNTHDVFLQVSQSFGRYWSDCPYRKYVGLNTRRIVPDGFTVVTAPVAGWREELRVQLSQLPPEFKYVILFLDDFLILSQVDGTKVQYYVNAARSHALSYLRLIPVTRPLLARFVHSLRTLWNGCEFERIPDHIPYYSSLQLAIWGRAHLEEMLETPGTIWEFEHQKPATGTHSALCKDWPVEYVHVVEKGRWDPNAAALFGRIGAQFDAGNRGKAPRSGRIWNWARILKFQLFGYVGMRLRIWRAAVKKTRGISREGQ